MKKISLILVVVLLFALSGCNSNQENCDLVDNETNEIIEDVLVDDAPEEDEQLEEFNQVVIIVKYRVDYYTFERGYYYAYKFTVEDTTNLFEHNHANWFYSNEKWEKEDVVIVTEDNGELYFVKIGSLLFEEEVKE